VREPDRPCGRRGVGPAGEPHEGDPGPVGGEEVGRAIADMEELPRRNPQGAGGPPKDRGRRLRVRPVGREDDRVEEPGASESPQETVGRLGWLVEDVRDDPDLQAAPPEPPERRVDSGLPPEVGGRERERDRVSDPAGVRPNVRQSEELRRLRGEGDRDARRLPEARPLFHRPNGRLGGPYREPSGDERLDPRPSSGPFVGPWARAAERDEGEPEVDRHRARPGMGSRSSRRHDRRSPNVRRRRAGGRCS
jgi:hypothetical protein